MPPTAEHEAQPRGVIRVDPVERPAWLVSAIIKVRRAIRIVGRSRIERVGDVKVHAADVHVVGPPLHLRVRQVLAAGPEDLHHRDVVRLAVHVADRAAEFGRLPGRVVPCDPLAHDELIEDGVDAAEVAVLLKREHVARAEIGVQVLPAVFEKVPDRQDLVLVAPLGDAAEERSAPRLREGLAILVLSGGLLLPGQRELPGHQRLLPVHTSFLENAEDLGAPIAARLRLVIEEPWNPAAEVLLESVVVWLVHRPDVPFRAVAAGSVDEVVSALMVAAIVRPPPKPHHLPLALRDFPSQRPVPDRAGQIDQTVPVDAVVNDLPCECGDEAI